MTVFFKQLLDLCDKFGTNPSNVAKNIGISTAAPTRWRNEDAIPQSRTLQKIASHFNVTVEYLLGQEEVFADDKQGRWVKVLGRVAAGVPIEAIEDIVDEEQLSPGYDSSYEYFGLRIHGDSMFPYYIEGDNVIVRRQSDCDSGDIAIILVNGQDATCKKVRKTDDGIELISLNEKYGAMCFTTEQIKTLPVVIIGKVVELRRKV